MVRFGGRFLLSFLPRYKKLSSIKQKALIFVKQVVKFKRISGARGAFQVHAPPPFGLELGVVPRKINMDTKKKVFLEIQYFLPPTLCFMPPPPPL